LNLAFSATIDSKVAEAPRGRYIPVSHSLMVCWRVPSLSDSSCWVRPRCRRRAWMLALSQCFGSYFRLVLMPAYYTMQCKRVNNKGIRG